MGRRPGNAGTAAAVAQLVPFQLVSPKNVCPRPWTERNLYPDRSPFGDRFGFVRPLLNFCVVRAKHLAQIVGTALAGYTPLYFPAISTQISFRDRHRIPPVPSEK